MASPKKKTPAQIQAIIKSVTDAGAKIHTSTVRRVRAGGETHIFRVRSYYDRATRNNAVIDSVLIGKLPKGVTDLAQMIPTDKKYSPKKVSLADVAQSVDDVPDERAAHLVQYPLDVVLFVILLAQMAGYNTCYAIAEFWAAQRDSLSKLIKDFPEKDISHDTVRRIIKLLGGQNTIDIIRRFTDPLIQQMQQKIISIDGQAMRAAITEENESPRYLMNAFTLEDQLCLRQIFIGPKENEITHAIKLLTGLNLRGAIVTADALNTQKNLCQFVIDQGADYCFALKGNHKNLYEEVQTWFRSTSLKPAVKELTRDDDGHGRKEFRTYRVLPANSNKLLMDLVTEWPGLEEGSVVETTTVSTDKKTGELSEDTRYFITSLRYDERYIAEACARAIRGHWGIETQLHWVLDVTMNQDRTQCKNGDFIKGKSSLNKVCFNFMSRIQAMIEKESGKKAPSKRALMARLSDIKQAIALLSQMYARYNGEVEI